MPSKIDVNKLSYTEQLALSQLLQKTGTSIEDLNKKNVKHTPEFIAKCIELRPKYIQMAIEEGVTLHGIFTASNKTRKTNGRK